MFEKNAHYRGLLEPDLDDSVVAVESDWNALVNVDAVAQKVMMGTARTRRASRRLLLFTI